MGIYVNSGNALFLQARRSEIYVDKSEIINYLNSVICTEQKYVCVSRPRRFGKSMAANMISSFYDRTCNAFEDFKGLKILDHEDCCIYANNYNTIHINMQDFLSEAGSVHELLENLTYDIVDEIKEIIPGMRMPSRANLPRVLAAAYSQTDIPFVIVIDEWDCLFREYKEKDDEQKTYLDFLRSLLKDKSYVALAYMTGILPIKKYGTHSALNIFSEFSMEHPDQLSSFVGFTEDETKKLCEKYGMDFEECRAWYDGYSFPDCRHLYSPKSVVDAMLRHRFGSYWNSTETYEALKIYIDINMDGLKDAVIKMMAGGRQRINTETFQNDMTSFKSADDVMTLLVHLGYLGYDIENSEVFIPNQEISREYVNATEQETGWKLISDSIRNSEELLKAVLSGDEKKVAEGIENAHFETSYLQYNDENALSYVLSLALYSARRYYVIFRELPSGKGFADVVYIPRPLYSDRPAIVMELKWDSAADTAIRQIKERKYVKALEHYSGEIVLAGISYDRKSKKHHCRIEKVYY